MSNDNGKGKAVGISQGTPCEPWIKTRMQDVYETHEGGESSDASRDAIYMKKSEEMSTQKVESMKRSPSLKDCEIEKWLERTP